MPASGFMNVKVVIPCYVQKRGIVVFFVLMPMFPVLPYKKVINIAVIKLLIKIVLQRQWSRLQPRPGCTLFSLSLIAACEMIDLSREDLEKLLEPAPFNTRWHKRIGDLYWELMGQK